MKTSPSMLPASPPAWRLSKLVWISRLLLVGSFTPLALAFNCGGLFVPARLGAQATNHYYLGSSTRDNNAIHAFSKSQVQRMSMSAANSSKANQFKSKNKHQVAAAALGLMAVASMAAVANAAKQVAVTTATFPEAVVPIVLPTISKLSLVCLIPTLLGYYRSEYGVSYGYGTAIAASSYLILSSVASSAGFPLFPGLGESFSLRSFQLSGLLASLGATLRNIKFLLPASLPAFHSFALLFYGTRLDLFLLYREVFLARFRAMRERIEERAKKQGGRLKRTPFLISCAFLYFCMICPLLITSKVCGDMSMLCGPGFQFSGGLPSILETSLRMSVVMALFGFLLGALGDLNKTIGKALKGEDALITGGIFRFFRHPNYTGEVIGWVSSCLAGFLAVTWKAVSICGGSRLSLWKSMGPYLILSVMGATGISFVLATATAGLEFRQKEKYGHTDEYQKWIKRSWVGVKMDPAKKGNNNTSVGDEKEVE
ncbi:hypothetical protein ACHAWF_008263 [Thalassiosira exigua]